MDANENLRKKRIVELGVVLMSFSIIPLFYFYAIVHSLLISGEWRDPFFSGIVNFVFGLAVMLIGLLSLLVGRLKKQ